MNLKSSRRTMVMLGVIACLLLALGVAIGIASAANPVAASPAVLHVKPTPTGSGNCSDWDNACTLQHALDIAVADDEIWVATGVYTPTTTGTDRTATFQLKNAVAVYGGFEGTETSREQRDWQSNVTVLSGDIDNNDIADPNGVVTTTTNITGTNSYHVVTGSSTDSSAILDGFTVTGGNADGSGDYNRGGGMWNDGSSPTLTNVTFSGNSAWHGGGMRNDDSSPTLTNVTFSGNSADYNAGGMFNASSSPTLTNVTFSGNSADLSGGGMDNWDSSPTLVNVTFSGNSATNGGGMYNWHYTSPSLTNCILWGNTAPSGPQIYDDGTSSATVTYSDIEGGYGGTGNIDEDPRFVDADGPDDTPGTPDDNLRLQDTSPAIDAGDNTAVPAGITTDLDGWPRFVDIPFIPDTGVGPAPIVDMGAYEAQPKVVYLPLVMKNYGP